MGRPARSISLRMMWGPPSHDLGRKRRQLDGRHETPEARFTFAITVAGCPPRRGRFAGDDYNSRLWHSAGNMYYESTPDGPLRLQLAMATLRTREAASH